MEPEDHPFPIQRSNLYGVWLLEHEEIARNKWFLSERVGYDVGWQRAKWDWEFKHRAGWISGLKAQGLYPA